jgi:hypothetical protein
MKPVLLRTPFAEAVFARLERVRERNPRPQMPWRQDWECFLEDAGMPTAEEAAEALRAALALTTDGLLAVKLRRDGERIQRFSVPLASEREWFTSYGRIHPADLPKKRTDLNSVAWVPELQFIKNSRINVVVDDLIKLNGVLAVGLQTKPLIPIKERSLEIFGDEKRLDNLLSSTLFRPGRLDLEQHLRCEVIGVPLAWKRGPVVAAEQPIIVIENAATWHSYCRWNEEQKLFSGVIYGDGNRFVDGIRYLENIFDELGGPRRILYFGDLDPQGLVIPQDASVRTQAVNQPAVEAHLWSYRQLITRAIGRAQLWEFEPPAPSLCDWLGDYAEPVRQLFASGKRIAQENIGWEFLQSERNPK